MAQNDILGPIRYLPGDLKQLFGERVSEKLHQRALYALALSDSWPLTTRIEASEHQQLATAVQHALHARKLHDNVETLLLLRAIAVSGLFREYGADKVPLLNRDLFWLGDLAAGADFARALDQGEHIPRNVERAGEIYAEIFSATLASALAEDRTAMFDIAECFAAGRGTPSYLGMERSFRIALYWYLRAAGGRNPFSRAPIADEFPDSLDALAIAAVTQVAKILEFGLGVPRNRQGAEGLYILAASHGGKAAQLRAIETQFEKGHVWIACGEKRHGINRITDAHTKLELLKDAGYGRASLANVAWFSWVDVENLPGYDDDSVCYFDTFTTVCTGACSRIKELYNDLHAATLSQLPEASRIHCYRLLLLWPNLTNQLFDGALPLKDVIAQAKHHWSNATVFGFQPEVSELALFNNDERLANLVSFKNILAWSIEHNILDYQRHAIEAQSKTRRFCPQSASYALANLIQTSIRSGDLRVTQAALDWCGLRYSLARLESDIHAGEWRRALIECQLASDLIIGNLNQAKGIDERIASSIVSVATDTVSATQGLMAWLRPSRTVASSDEETKPDNNSSPQAVRRLQYRNRRREVIRSTQAIGPSYNRLHSQTGTPIPYLLPPRHGSTRAGWDRVDAITVETADFKIHGSRSDPGTMPLITRDDVEVLLCCQFVQRMDQSLSLERLLGLGQEEIIECQFRVKVWDPEWLSETDLGRSLYYSDRLLGLEENGWRVCSLEGHSLQTAEDSKQWILPEPWRTARMVGGVTTTAVGRVMHTPFSMRWHQPSMPSKPAGNSGSTCLPIPHVTSGVVGADIAVHTSSNYEDRRVGENNLRFHWARYASVLSQRYDEMEQAFPVFRRTSQIHAINAGLYSARVHHDVQLAPPLQQHLTKLRDGLDKARKRRLKAGGLDIVLR